jgi:hypothetical protein
MPTVKQRLAFKEVLKGSTLTKAMSKAGYAPTTASTTGKLTNTRGWEELMEKTLSDKALLKIHQELLNKKEKIVLGIGKGYSAIEDTNQPHSDAVKALDIGYKLKHRYSDGKDTHVNINIIQGVEINIRKHDSEV